MHTATYRAPLAGLAFLLVAVLARTCAAEPMADFQLETLQGRVVFLNETLAAKFGITTVPEASDRTLALEAEDGSLVPLIEDVRGRAFRVDERLRKLKVELLVRRYAGVPGVRVIRVFEVAADGKYEVDYWCDICAIAMVELKPCECCQGETEFRRRKVETAHPPDVQKRQ
jgi:hypothetical protein